MTRGLLLHKSQLATAQSIQKGSAHRMDSDDFVTPENVEEQLYELQRYIDLRREVEPMYILPKPSGWKLMVLVLTIPEKTTGGIIVIDDAKDAKSIASPQGVILDMGPAAYTDASRFTVNGTLTPWHIIGDRVSFVRYDASMFQLANGQRLGFLNDTQPLSRVDTGWEIPE